MKKSSLLRVLGVVVACLVLGWAPKSVFAQRGGGGHGGGGGFHGGGGGFHGGGGGFHGGGGGFHGGGAGFHGGGGGFRGGGSFGRGFYGGRGGFGRGGFRGFRGYGRYGYGRYPYGYGWPFGFGFGWGWPYWYPYGYGYSPWWYAPDYYPYYYPYDAPYDYPYPDNGSDDSPRDPGPRSRDHVPANPSRAPEPESGPNADGPRIAASAPDATLYPTGGTIATASAYRPAHSVEQLPPARRRVQDAIRAAREMPPYAFQRRIDSGRYSDFTPEERELVNNAVQFQLAWEKP